MRFLPALALIIILAGCGSEENTTPEPQAAAQSTEPQSETPTVSSTASAVDFNITGFIHETEELFRLSGDDYIKISRDQDAKGSPFYREDVDMEIKAWKFSMATENPLVVHLSIADAASANAANEAVAYGLSSRLIDQKRHHYVFQSGLSVGHLALSCDYPFERFEELQARLLNALREPAMDREEVFPCQ